MRASPLVLSALWLLPWSPPAYAAEAKPPTKQQEREKFHPRVTGMEAAPRLAGFERRRGMEKASLLGAVRFRNVGPEVQGGRVVDIEGPANHPDSLLVAFATGGLWRTDSRGGSWTPLFDEESSTTIGDFALGDADGKVMYVGTGENNSSRTSYAGTGVFKTTDGGKTWTNVGLLDSHHIGRVVVDPRDSQTVYVAATGHLYSENAERGVYKTTDGGKTWKRVLFVNDRTGAIDLVQDPTRPDVLYAAMWERVRAPWNFLESGPGSGIWKSTDAGATWSRLAGGLPTGETVGRIGLALAASRPQTLYAVIDNQERRPDSEANDEEAPPGELTPRRLRTLTAQTFGRLDDAVVTRFLRRYGFPRALRPARLKRDLSSGRTSIDDLVGFIRDANRDLFENEIVQAEVYRSDDGGATWRRTHESRLEKVFFSYGYYFARITVDPRDPERIYFGGLNLLGSTDGGKTWTGLDRRGVHADQHVVFADPRNPQRLALGNDGGLNVSYDYGQTWTKVNNLPVGQFTTIAVDNADPYNIAGGLQDNGVMRGPSNYRYGRSDPAAWRSIYGGDGSCVVIDPKDANVVYAASQFGNASRLNVRTNERAQIRPRPEFSAEKKEKPLRYNWIAPFILSPHSNQILYFGTNRLYRSFDRGETWGAISGDLTANREQGDVPFGTITYIAESPKKFGVIWVGTDEGKVWGTRDGGVVWTDLSAGLARDRWVSRVVASNFDEGTVYVAQNGYRNDDFAAYVWRSKDYGKTWESLAAGLPPEPINVVQEDPRAAHLLFVGTDLGVFASLDRGKTWDVLSSGLPRVPVHDLVVQPRDGDLVVATHGRSVFVADVTPLRRLRAPLTEVTSLRAFPVKSAQADLRRGYGENPWTAWSREEPLVRISFWSKGAGTAEVRIKDATGNVWKELSTPAQPGLNVFEYDLSADPAKADVAEEAARKAALEKEKAKPPAAEAGRREGATDENEEEGGGDTEDRAGRTDEESGGRGTPAAAPKPLDDELKQLLADPLRASRRRYLAAGTYTVEIRSGSETATTSLRVRPPRGERPEGGPEEDESKD